MTKYVLSRFAQILVTLFLFLTLVFFITSAQPGDFSNVFDLDPSVPPGPAREQIQRAFGLDKPLWQQYLIYAGNFFTGDFGVSHSSLYPRTVADIVKERLPRTVVLFVTAAAVSFYLGFALGKIMAWRRGGLTVGGVSLYTVFTPWFSLMIIWIFAFKLKWFPLGKFLDPAYGVMPRSTPITSSTGCSLPASRCLYSSLWRCSRRGGCAFAASGG